MNKRQKVLSWFMENRVFAVICIVECLFLLAMCVRLVRPAIVIDVEPQSFLALNQKNTQLNPEDGSLVIQDPAQKLLTEKEADKGEYISDFYTLSTGTYLLRVEYESITDLDKPSNTLSDKTGVLAVRSFTDQAALVSETIPLRDGQSVATTRVWIKPEGRLKDVQLTINYTGVGRLTIKQVTFEEQVVGRWVLLFCFLLAFLLIDALYCVFLSRRGGGFLAFVRRYRYECCAAAVVLAGSMPLLMDQLIFSHDQVFHMARIGALAEELGRGQFPVRMMNGMLNGYGYTTPLYYCDIFLYLPALLYNCMLPLSACYQIYIFLVNVCTCAISFYSFYKITNSKAVALAGTAVYNLSVYRITCLYIRGAAGEYTAMTFLPLLALGLWNIYHKPKGEKICFREYLPLGLGMAGIAMCHILTLEMAAIFLVLIALCLLPRTLQPKRLLALLKAAALMLGLALWFLVPLVESMGSMSIWGNQLHVLGKVQRTGLYPIQIFNPFPQISHSHTLWGMRGEMPLSLGLPLIAAMLLCLYLLLKRQSWSLEEDGHYKLMRGGLLTGLAAVCFSLYCFPWDSIENWLGPNAEHYLTMFQFSYRFLGLAIIAFSVMFTAGLLLVRRYGKPQSAHRIAAVFAACLLLSVSWFYGPLIQNTDLEKYYDYNSLPQEIIGTVASGEYLLTDCDIFGVYDMNAYSGTGLAQAERDPAYEDGSVWSCQNSGPETELTLPVFRYDHFHVLDQATGEELVTSTDEETKRISVTIPEGYEGSFQVRYIAPSHWRVCEGASLLTALLIGWLLWHSRRKKKPGTV